MTLYDGKASVGRKFLVAGRGGLNITKVEPRERFAAQYRGPDQPPGLWASLLAEFSPEALRAWAAELGVETFVASTGRVYPRELKAAPLLRRWVERLRELGVRMEMHHRLTGLIPGSPLGLTFETRSGTREIAADASILALGGGSWPQTGSDGTWPPMLERLGVRVTPLQPANCGWELDWPEAVLAQAEGQPLKNIVVGIGTVSVAGELLITKYGLEGGALYQLGAVLRTLSDPVIAIDLKPDITQERLAKKLVAGRGDLLSQARIQWRLSPAAFAVLESFAGENVHSAEALAGVAKRCLLRLNRPRLLAEAISSAGGVSWSEIDGNLMLRAVPGVFVAGEMMDWEAPTGGYLIQGCFATGDQAAGAALNYQCLPG